MKTARLKKMALAKETLRNLADQQLWRVKGGLVMTETETQNIHCGSEVAVCTGFCYLSDTCW
jgi:hypothetical protein